MTMYSDSKLPVAQNIIFDLLGKYGYEKVHLKGSVLLRNSLQNSFEEKYGFDFARDVVNSLNLVGNKDVFYDYSQFVEQMYSLYDEKIAKNMVDNLDSSLCSALNIDEKKCDIEKILFDLNRQDSFEKIRCMKEPGNIVMLFSKIEHQKEILEEFFEPTHAQKALTGLFAHEINPNSGPQSKTILYSDIEDKGHLNIDLILDFFGTVYKKNSKNTTKFACADTMWFTKNGYSKEHQQVVEKLDREIKQNSVILCCYNLELISLSHLKSILQSKPIVILADTYSIFTP